MSQFHAAKDVRPDWTRGAEELCAVRADVASYLRRLYLPLRREGDALVVALADTAVENKCWIEASFGAVRFLEVPRAELLNELSRRFETALTDEAIFSLAREQPELSAQHFVSRAQGVGLTVLAAASICALIWSPLTTTAVFVVAMTLVFIAGTFFRVLLSWLGGLPRKRLDVPQRDDPALPVYSILVPLYREAKIVPDLLRALSSLEYPRDRLDIKIIVEADDLDTIAACEGLQAPNSFDLVRVPPSLPRTKPKAINYALRFARGDYLVIFDAEDRPEPDQLLKAVATFRSAPRRIACLQARLAFHNQDRWLSNGLMAQTPRA